MKPLIGITCSRDYEQNRYFVPVAYVRAVTAAGGQALVLPPAQGGQKEAQNLLSLLDGLVLSGGGDLDPVVFGEEPAPGLGEIDPERDWWELALTRLTLAAGKPLLGICRGIQVLNVAAGGSIWQDISNCCQNPLQHMQNAPRWYPTHTVDMEPGSRLAQILKTKRLRVNSFHHQGLKEPAPDLTVAARSADGIIEAVELNRHPFTIGVQWHPEAMWEKHAPMHWLFQAFVATAGQKTGR